jgi:hypothetical protein
MNWRRSLVCRGSSVSLTEQGNHGMNLAWRMGLAKHFELAAGNCFRRLLRRPLCY